MDSGRSPAWGPAWPVWPERDERTGQAVAAAVASGRWAIASPRSAFPSHLDRVERRLAAAFGRAHCVTTCNGSAAIVIALQALGIGPGDRVLVPATTWVGCATAVLRVGARPVFADTAPEAPLAAPWRGEGPLQAILAVHLYASQLDVAALRERHPGVPVVEDLSHCATAAGADGAPLGGGGDVAVVSFQATKVLSCGEGGAAFTDDPELARRLAALRADSRLRDEAAPGSVPLRPGDVHGANFALSEISAALLAEQLDRLPEQKRRRAQGAAALAAALAASPLRAVADEWALAGGAFYGLPLVLRGAAAGDGGAAALPERLRPLAASYPTAVRLDRVYPPLPEGPLYRPDTVAAYRRLPDPPAPTAAMEAAEVNPAAMEPAPLERSRWWHENAVVLPHEVFLAPAERLVRLAADLAALAAGERRPAVPVAAPGAAPAPRPVPVPRAAPEPEVTVVVLTRPGSGRPLRRALESAAAQTYGGPLVLLVVGDGGPADPGELAGLARPSGLARPAGLRVESVAFDLAPARQRSTIERVARLRDLALRLVESPRVCFLDDDNRWLPDHLARLAERLDAVGVPAAHSWRRLEDAAGTPWHPDRFPWLPAGAEERRLFALYVRHGVLDPASPVVRDRVSLPVAGEELGMVDLGEWLLSTELLRRLGFAVRYTAEERARRVGEDDKLLARLRQLGVPTACSERPTLVYGVGGFSNPLEEETVWSKTGATPIGG